MKNCLRCEKEFESKYINAKYCSGKCGQSAAKRREYIVRKESGLCHVCGIREKYNGYVRCRICTDKHNIDNKKRNDKNRIKFIKLYGQKCKCCNESQIDFLTLDHIANDGNNHRQKINQRAIIVDAITNYQPDKYQILCMNCNWGKRLHGVCPHKLSIGTGL